MALPPVFSLCRLFRTQFSVILKMCSLPKSMTFIGVPVTSAGPRQIVGGSALDGPFTTVTSKQMVIWSDEFSVHVVGSNLASSFPFPAEKAPPPPTVPSSNKGPPIQPPCPRAASVQVYSTAPAAARDADSPMAKEKVPRTVRVRSRIRLDNSRRTITSLIVCVRMFCNACAEYSHPNGGNQFPGSF